MFPSGRLSADPEGGAIRRHDLDPDTLVCFVRSPLDRLEQPREGYAA